MVTNFNLNCLYLHIYKKQQVIAKDILKAYDDILHSYELIVT